jgi:molybdenum cofactor cytidylyltransferase
MTPPVQQKIAGIILAAGRSVRMGRTKQLLPFKDSTILGTVLNNALASDLDSLIVVLGHDAGPIRDSLSHELSHPKVKTVLNPHYRDGQSSSIVAGITALGNEADAVMFLLGDQPLIRTDTLNLLIRAFRESAAGIIIPFYRKKRGNPVIFDRTLFKDLAQLSKDTGARVLFDKHTGKIHKISLSDPGILADIDTPEEYHHYI